MTVIKAWSRLSSKRLADSRIMSFCEARDQSPYTDKAHDFVYLDSVDWVNIVPITAQQEVVMIKQYRHGDQSISLEIPGGMVDANEQAMQAACRECMEETGYQVSNVRAFGVLSPNPAIFNNRLHCFVAELAETAADAYTNHHSATEKTEVVLMPIAELAPAMLSGEINHALVCATLWRFLALRQASDENATAYD